jgi:transcriptional regulator with XRE-family HTH domain
MTASKIENVRQALAKHRNKTALADRVGCTPDTLHKIARGFIRDPRASLIDSICDVLMLDRTTGLPATEGEGKAERRIKAKVKQPPASHRRAPVLTSDDEYPLPDEFEIEPEEARLILERRMASKPEALFLLALDQVRLATDLTAESDREIKALGRAAENLLQQITSSLKSQKTQT